MQIEKTRCNKHLLVETHLTESRIHHGLLNFSKAKAAMTAARTVGNTIYVVLLLQAELDMMSGVLHCEEEDYKISFSYFLEAFEALNTATDAKTANCLKYMIFMPTFKV